MQPTRTLEEILQIVKGQSGCKIYQGKSQNTESKYNVIKSFANPSRADIMMIVNFATKNTKLKRDGNPKKFPVFTIMLANVHPKEALEGMDELICGNCSFRKNGLEPGTRACYVDIRGIISMYKKDKSLNPYPILTPVELGILFKHWNIEQVRLGGYGDPACIPFKVWSQVKSINPKLKSIGYTHQANRNWFDSRWLDFCMESVDPTNKKAFHNSRSFRVVGQNYEPTTNEIICPDNGCQKCMLCNGKDQRKNIVMRLHGSIAKVFYNFFNSATDNREEAIQ